MKKLINTLFFLLFLIIGCNVNRDIERTVSNLPFFVSYENYKDNDFCIPTLLFDQFPKTEVTFCDTLFSTMYRSFDTSFKVENELFELLSESDVINGWAYNPTGTMHDGKTRADFIRDLKQKRFLYYLGEIPFSKRYNSHVFLSSSKLNDDYFEFYEVFLVNMQNQFVKSIIRAYVYCVWNGDCGSTMMIREGKNIFLQKQFDEGSDNIVFGEENCQDDDIPAFCFRFDRNGYVEIIDYISE